MDALFADAVFLGAALVVAVVVMVAEAVVGALELPGVAFCPGVIVAENIEDAGAMIAALDSSDWTTRLFGTNVVVEVVTRLLTAGDEKEDTCGTKVIEAQPPVNVATPPVASPAGRAAIAGGLAMLECTEDVIGEDAVELVLVRVLLCGLASTTSTELAQEERCIFIHIV